VQDSKTLKLLVVEDNLEDEQLVCEALIEIEEHRQWVTWRTSSIVHVEQLADALDCLRQERFDAILLNLSLPDCPALLEAFLETNAHARGAPIVVLADEEDENLANLLLREGAQDVLVKSELDCAPLARALRYAIERQRRTATLRSAPFLDDLTGTLTREGFFTIAEHYSLISQTSRASLLAATIEFPGDATENQEDREGRQILLMQAGQVLRSTFYAPSILGLLDRCHFGLITVNLTRTTVAGLLNRAAREIEEAAGLGDGQSTTVRFTLAELEAGLGIEELFGKNAAEFAMSTHQCAKTVMLAD